MASLFRPVGRKKNLFSYALQTLALKYINFYALLSTYLGRALKKTCQASEKSAPKSRFSGPFYTFSIPFQPFKHTRFRAETRTKTSGVVTSTKSGLLTLILYTWTPCGFGLVPKRNLWFPGCWENLYLKVNLFFPSSRDAHLHVCFKKNLHSYFTIRGMQRNGSFERRKLLHTVLKSLKSWRNRICWTFYRSASRYKIWRWQLTNSKRQTPKRTLR